VQEAMKYPTPRAHQVASNISSTEGRYEQAITEADRAIALDGDDPVGYFAMGSALVYAGSPNEGAEFLYKAMELNPHYPPEYVFWLGMASFCMDRFDEAAISLERARKLVPADVNTTLALAATYGHLGREQEAKSIIATLNGLAVQAGYENGVRDIDIWPFKEPADRERVRAGLRKAGLSDLPRG
jgi:tetratricopeptide (TPR) repeat protein